MITLQKIRSLLLIVLSVLTFQASATPQELLSNVHKLRLLSTGLMTNFYMYSGLDADTKYGKKVLENLAEFETTLAEAKALPAAEGISDSFSEIDTNWHEFNKLMRINYGDMEKQGFPNVRLVDEMGKTHTILLNSLSKAYIDTEISTGTKPVKAVEVARTLAVTISEITSQYSARGTSNLGQVFMGSYERTLDQMATAFGQDFTSLQAQIDTTNSRGILRSIDSKWNFIERSIKNYNENTVPFLVTSYSERIVDHLEEIVALHDF